MYSSGHKIYGPTGIGVLYGKEGLLSDMPPYQGGGDMVDRVTFKKTTYNVLPFKFEAGTSNYIAAIGMGEAIDYVINTGLNNISGHEHKLLLYATEKVFKSKALKFMEQQRTKFLYCPSWLTIYILTIWV